MSESLPAPLVLPHVDLRDEPIPIEIFARLAAAQFEISIEDARVHARDVVARMQRDVSLQRGRQ